MVHPQDQQLSIEAISGNHVLEFSESELFPNSDVGSTIFEKHPSYQIQLSSITAGMSILDDNEIPPPPSTNTMPPPILFDDDSDISAAIDFTTSPSFSYHQYLSSSSNNNDNDDDANQDAFDISSLSSQLDMAPNGSSYGERWPGYEEECMPSFMRLKASQPQPASLMDSMMVPYLPPPTVPFPSAQSSGAFMGMLPSQDLEFQVDNTGFFIPDNMQRVFNCSTDLQTLSNESQHLYHGGATTATTSSLASEISSLEDPTYKVGKISVEERKRKIHRYLKKRNERNFNSRPRVRGRFAKNDELGEVGRHMGNNHEDDVDEDFGLYSTSIPDRRRKVVKEEDDSSDILAHISGVHSLKCNYPIQSWI
ncbi:hypothetical protein SASPL_145867 [Salvia splendens]|uniref:CCT domain-containing protein n=1 Tax=Salvia splendens TaxID=180675 RepID=A0A8X8WIB8_SALSN|nr:hypothetical protein SASPL_145867 [Salvia splendens]